MCPSALVKLICTGISSPFLLCVSTFTVDASGQLTNLDLETAANPFKYEFLRGSKSTTLKLAKSCGSHSLYRDNEFSFLNLSKFSNSLVHFKGQR